MRSVTNEKRGMGIGAGVLTSHAVKRVGVSYGYGEQVKIVCRIPWSVERDAKLMLLPGESEEDGKKRVIREYGHRDIRPCGFHHAWVEKRTCGATCNGFVRRIEDEKEAGH